MKNVSFLERERERELSFIDNLPPQYYLNEIKADVVFGRPSKECVGVGICKVTVSAKTNNGPSTCKHAKAVVKKNFFGQLEFYFNNSSINCEKGKMLFQGKYFTILETIVLPAEIRQALGLKIGAIKVGQYPILKMKDTILITFS